MWIELTNMYFKKKVNNCLNNVDDFSNGNVIFNTVQHYVHITRKHKSSLKQYMPQGDNIIINSWSSY